MTTRSTGLLDYLVRKAADALDRIVGLIWPPTCGYCGRRHHSWDCPE